MEQQAGQHTGKKSSATIFVGALFILFTGYIFAVIYAEVISQKYIQKRDTIRENMQTPVANNVKPTEPQTVEQQQQNIQVKDDGRMPVRQGLVYWLKTNDIVGVTYDQQVGVIPDASGQQHHSIQQNAGSRPVLLSKGINDMPAVRFDGQDDFFFVGDIGGEKSDATIFVVWAKPQEGGVPFQRLFSSSAKIAENNQPVFDYQTASLYSIVPSENNGVNAAPPQLLVSSVAAADLRNFVVGRLNTHVVQTAKADIGEILVFNRTLQPEEKTKVEQYLKAKFKL